MKPIDIVHMIAPQQHELTFVGERTGTEVECIALALINQFNTYAQDFDKREPGMDSDEHAFVLGEMTRVMKLIRKMQKETGLMWIKE